MHRGTRCPLGFTPFSASRSYTRTSLATRSRKFYSTGSIWATIRKTIPRRNSTSLTASQSDGSPTISETQTPQKHERELVTLETGPFVLLIIENCAEAREDNDGHLQGSELHDGDPSRGNRRDEGPYER